MVFQLFGCVADQLVASRWISPQERTDAVSEFKALVPCLRHPRMTNSVDPLAIDMTARLFTLPEFTERKAVVRVFHMLCLLNKSPAPKIVPVSFDLRVVSFPHWQFYSALHSVQSLSACRGFSQGVFFTPKTLDSVRECLQNCSAFVGDAHYNPWGPVYLNVRSKIEKDLRASYQLLRDRAVSRREKELMSSSKRRNLSKVRKGGEVSSEDRCVEATVPASVVCDTPVTSSGMSGSVLRESDSLAKSLLHGVSPILRAAKLPPVVTKSVTVVSSCFPTDAAVSSSSVVPRGVARGGLSAVPVSDQSKERRKRVGSSSAVK